MKRPMSSQFVSTVVNSMFQKNPVSGNSSVNKPKSFRTKRDRRDLLVMGGIKNKML